MAPKKKGKGKKKAEEVEVPLDPDEANIDLENQRLILESQLQKQEEEEQQAMAVERELKGKLEELETNLKEERANTVAVTADMARQFKALQESLIHKISSLETTLTEQKDILDITEHELMEMTREKENEISQHRQRALSLKHDMDEMSAEFADMLRRVFDMMRSQMGMKILEGGDHDHLQSRTQRRLQDITADSLSAGVAPVSVAGGGGGAAEGRPN
uniref:Dynein regulatory complex protein 12 n=1 Tax=Chromera velia CCMP2878 TaxID=1169474 RepID=A0A0G4HDY6_9ALVE|eukprot:Cvel_26472.t1-p1 / transcript=Cvel_26472.t1 / gene=Cvel_26472 / organism=Chromera_velia_CCMP2878 / gene_product=hypothetical protein / transcript_product=hypothetical protein / location=Cvel_scaffold3152:3701-6521(-) / protein_length=216 / sequence_SO=supercontig / SO=protein_coding / is_pseudo=false